jgi:nucleotide-binding universal stress UspA family protein
VVETVRTLRRISDMNIPGTPVVDVVRSDDPTAAILAKAAECDLLVLGLQSRGGRKAFGGVTLKIARGAPCAVILLASKQASMSELYRPIVGAVQVLSPRGSRPGSRPGR